MLLSCPPSEVTGPPSGSLLHRNHKHSRNLLQTLVNCKGQNRDSSLPKYFEQVPQFSN